MKLCLEPPNLPRLFTSSTAGKFTECPASKCVREQLPDLSDVHNVDSGDGNRREGL